MGFNDYQGISGAQNQLVVTKDADGIFISAGGLALRDALRRGTAGGVMELLGSLNSRGVSTALREAGFSVAEHVERSGREAILTTVHGEITSATVAKTDGFGLRASQQKKLADQTLRATTFAAKLAAQVSDGVVPTISATPDPIEVVQAALQQPGMKVALIGDVVPEKRNSLLFIAGQAIAANKQGFGFEGIDGKYEVELTMEQVAALHRTAAGQVARESARTGLGTWVRGSKAHGLSELLPDSIQRLLVGSVSLVAAQAVVDAIDNGMIVGHAEEIGAHKYAALLAEQGYDVESPTVADKAKDIGLALKDVDRERGKYFGPVVAVDHRAALVKFSRSDAVILPFKDLPADKVRPRMGDALKISFSNGNVDVTVASQSRRESYSR